MATSGPWMVFEVADSELVAPLDNQPAVLTDVGHGPGRVAGAGRRLVPGPDRPRRAPGRRRPARVAADRRRARTHRPCPSTGRGHQHRGGRRPHQLRRRPDRPARPGEGLVLPELGRVGRRRPLPGRPRTSWSWSPPTPTSSSTTAGPRSTSSPGCSPCWASAAWCSWPAGPTSTCPPRPCRSPPRSTATDPPDVLDDGPATGLGRDPPTTRTSRRRSTRRTRPCPTRSRWARRD